MFDISRVFALTAFKGKTTKELAQGAYEAIGIYIKEHSEELAASISENCQGAELKIIINANEIITLENKIIYYPTRKVEN